MRINRKTLALIVASLCGTCGSALAQDAKNGTFRSSAGRIGDGGIATSTVSPYDAPSASSGGTSAYAVGNPSSMASYYNPAMDGTSVAPASSSRPSYSSSYIPSSGLSTSRNGWFETDHLLWWGRGQTTAPVVVGGATTGALPTTPLSGGQTQPVGGTFIFGQRVNVGAWIDDEQNYGVGARAWGILSNMPSNTYVNNGNSTGVQFFNTTLGQPDTYLVNFDAGVLGSNTGTIRVANDLDVISSDVYLRSALIKDARNRVDLLSGYTFLRLDSAYDLQTSFTDGIINALPNGTVTSTRDTFSTKNEFHGGHLGFLNDISYGRVGFSLMGKVAMGNMNSRSTISGQFTQTGNPALNRGLFAQTSNIGTTTVNRFTFIPEGNARMRYQVGRVQLGVGYTILVLPNIAMAASQVDKNIDLGGVLVGNPLAPNPKFNTEAYFLHGIDLGVTLNF